MRIGKQCIRWETTFGVTLCAVKKQPQSRIICNTAPSLAILLLLLLGVFPFLFYCVFNCLFVFYCMVTTYRKSLCFFSPWQSIMFFEIFQCVGICCQLHAHRCSFRCDAGIPDMKQQAWYLNLFRKYTNFNIPLPYLLLEVEHPVLFLLVDILQAALRPTEHQFQSLSKNTFKSNSICEYGEASQNNP